MTSQIEGQTGEHEGHSHASEAWDDETAEWYAEKWGNHPSNAIVAAALTPSVLGQLVAAYEHRVFTQGVIWGINSFDQWGVELGKVMANQLAPKLQSEQAPAYDSDPSTDELVRFLRAERGRPA